MAKRVDARLIWISRYRNTKSTLRPLSPQSRTLLRRRARPKGPTSESASNRAAFQSSRSVPKTLHTSATQEFGRSFLDETTDAFCRVFRGLQLALLLLQLSRGDVRPFEYSLAGVREGRRDRARGLLANQVCDFDRPLALTSGRDHFLHEP
jgi:hypothetical protein